MISALQCSFNCRSLWCSFCQFWWIDSSGSTRIHPLQIDFAAGRNSAKWRSIPGTRRSTADNSLTKAEDIYCFRPVFTRISTTRRSGARRSLRSGYAFSHSQGFGDLIVKGKLFKNVEQIRNKNTGRVHPSPSSGLPPISESPTMISPVPAALQVNIFERSTDWDEINEVQPLSVKILANCLVGSLVTLK